MQHYDTPFFAYPLALVIGAVVGSFVNVVIYRLPSVAQAGIRPTATRGVSYLALPMSYCTHCGAYIKPWHNIPLLSWMILRGRSACCGRPISPDYLIVEAAGAALAVACLHRFGMSMTALSAGVFCLTLLAIGWIDARRYIIPDLLVIPLLWAGLFVNLFIGFTNLHTAVAGAISGYLFLLAFSEGSSALMHKRMLGPGDAKLFAAIGAWMGWEALPAALVIASLSASIYGAGKYLADRRRRAIIPFGPHLVLAALVVLFFGNRILPLYINLP